MGSESLGFEKDSLKSRQGRRDDYYPFDVENSDFSTGVSLQRMISHLFRCSFAPQLVGEICE